MKKIAIITSTRADYGILRPLISALHSSTQFDLKIIVTGMHLSEDFGNTVDEISEDGFSIAERINIGINRDHNITSSMGQAVSKFGDYFLKNRPDVAVVLGDRFEILGVTQAAHINSLPIVHIAGGDITEGAYDDAIRHCLTKLSHIHFTTNEEAKKRVIQMGEDSNLVFNVGSLGVENILQTNFMTTSELEENLGISFGKKNFLITYHPETNYSDNLAFDNLLSSLDKLEDTNFYFTYPNADKGGERIFKLLDEFIKNKSNAFGFKSLGTQRYFSMIKACDVVIGNSSSGLYEVPSFKVPTVNIGDRQKGRILAESVIQCDESEVGITNAIERALSLDCSKAINPYGDGETSEKMISILNGIKDFNTLLRKRFFEN